MRILLFCALLLSGCAATTLALAPLDTQPIQAQFGLRFIHAGTAIPLQGAVRMKEHEGDLGVIFPHGRTLGVCRYQDGGMVCTSAVEDRFRTRFMLQQIGLAVYRLLPALSQESPQDVTEADWSVRWKEADTGRSAEYRDLASQVTMYVHFTETTQP